MARKNFGAMDAALLDRVDARARELGQSRVTFVSRALEAALASSITYTPTPPPEGTGRAKSTRSAKLR
jgi:hypothetical protein